MNYRYTKNNNSRIVITKNFIYKQFLKDSFDKKTIEKFCLLDKQFNKRPLMVDVLDKKDISYNWSNFFVKSGSKIIKMKRFPEESNGFCLLKKNKISKLNISNIVEQLYSFHFNSGGFIKKETILQPTGWHVDIFLERAKRDKLFFNTIKSQIKNIKKTFKESRFEYKKIRIHGDFLISNMFFYKQECFYVDFGHLDRHCQDLFLKDVSSFYVDLILNKKDNLAKHFLSEYLNLVGDKKIKSLVDAYNLNDLFFRYIINDGFYKKTDKNDVSLKLIQANITKILNEQNKQKN